MSSVDPLDLSRFTVRQLFELEACTRCGECVQWCPTYTERHNEEITPLSKIGRYKSFVKGQYGGFLARLFGYGEPTKEQVKSFGQGTFQCTLCGRCHVVCPVQIRTRPLWIAMREQLVAWHEYPPVFDQLRDTVTSHYNISGDDNKTRLIWSENLDDQPPTVASKPQAENVYFVGCVGSFYPTVFGIPQAFVSLLGRAALDYTMLSGEEWCCGYPLLISGMRPHIGDLIRHNVETVRSTGARRLITTCPSCYHTWKHEYPEVIGEPLGFEVVHAVELLADLIEEGSLVPGPYGRPVTYHDPCDLGRNSGIYDAPRRILQAIPDLIFREMQDNREYSLCCGGGGDAEMADADITTSVAHRRLEQAQAVGAQVVVSACQQCKRTLAGQARKEKLRLKALDITELLWETLQ